jgi:hypothetical protein
VAYVFNEYLFVWNLIHLNKHIKHKKKHIIPTSYCHAPPFFTGALGGSTIPGCHGGASAKESCQAAAQEAREGGAGGVDSCLAHSYIFTCEEIYHDIYFYIVLLIDISINMYSYG